ncbi:MAG TPA: hypothetical protein PLO50_10745, partial [Nitrospira sp.]|nr:hypothetical protein [Nitrospira sp.]
MISTVFIFIIGFVALLCGNPLLAVAGIPSVVIHTTPESRPDHAHKPLTPHFISFSTLTAGTLHDPHEQTGARTVSHLFVDEQASLIQTARVGAAQKPATDHQQLVAQLAQREQDSTPRGHSEKELSQELSTTRNSLQQARQRIDELERQLAEGNLETAKRRIGELVIQLHAKESEIATLRASVHENSKKFREDLAAQTEELAQAKRRISEVEQQMASTGKGQELAQAKRRVTDLEQQLTKKEQDLTQTKRRVMEAEQQMAAKEQDL